MKKLLFVTFLIYSITNFAQNKSNLTIYESPEYKDKVRTDSVRAMYSSDSGKTGVVRNDKKVLVFDLFDDKLFNIHSKTIETERREAYIGDIFYNNEIKVFTETFPDKDIKLLSCYILNLDDKTSKKQLLSSTTIDKKLSLYSNKKDAKFSLSPDSKYFSITTYTIHRDEIFFHVSVFDSKSYKLIYDQKITRKENKFYSMAEILIDNNLNVYISGESSYDENSPKLKNEENRYLTIEKISQKNHSKLKLDFKDKFVNSIKIAINRDELIIYGFYSESIDTVIDGICDISINMEKFKIIDETFQKLPSQVHLDLSGNYNIHEKTGNGLGSLKIDHLLSDSEDNIYLLAEEFFITYSNYGTYYEQKTENYNDIVIIKFNSNREIEWGRSIYKKDYNPSYNVFLKNDDLHLILNSGKNLEKLDDGRLETSKDLFETSALYDFMYRSDGEVIINKIQNNQGKTIYLPNYGNYVNGKFIMISDTRKNRQFMVLE